MKPAEHALEKALEARLRLLETTRQPSTVHLPVHRPAVSGVHAGEFSRGS